jgi:uncharacterized metal-binding protein
METNKPNCSCRQNGAIVLACSGASDVGQISDLTARKLRDCGIFKMSCLALVGAGVEASIENFKKADVLVIDGCPVDCGKKIMERNGIKNYKYLRLSDIGLAKGSSPANVENIDIAFSKALDYQ